MTEEVVLVLLGNLSTPKEGILAWVGVIGVLKLLVKDGEGGKPKINFQIIFYSASRRITKLAKKKFETTFRPNAFR